MYDSVLLPTDGSPAAEAAIDHAIHIATQNDATVHAVHVAEITEFGDITEGARDVDDGLREGGKELLAPVLKAADDAGVDVVDTVLRGTAHERLVEYVEDRGIDVVVMGTHGKSGLSRVLLGSTAEKMVRHSPAPVLTVRSREDASR